MQGPSYTFAPPLSSTTTTSSSSFYPDLPLAPSPSSPPARPSSSSSPPPLSPSPPPPSRQGVGGTVLIPQRSRELSKSSSLLHLQENYRSSPQGEFCVPVDISVFHLDQEKNGIYRQRASISSLHSSKRGEKEGESLRVNEERRETRKERGRRRATEGEACLIKDFSDFSSSKREEKNRKETILLPHQGVYTPQKAKETPQIPLQSPVEREGGKIQHIEEEKKIARTSLPFFGGQKALSSQSRGEKDVSKEEDSSGIVSPQRARRIDRFSAKSEKNTFSPEDSQSFLEICPSSRRGFSHEERIRKAATKNEALPLLLLLRHLNTRLSPSPKACREGKRREDREGEEERRQEDRVQAREEDEKKIRKIQGNLCHGKGTPRVSKEKGFLSLLSPGERKKEKEEEKKNLVFSERRDPCKDRLASDLRLHKKQERSETTRGKVLLSHSGKDEVYVHPTIIKSHQRNRTTRSLSLPRSSPSRTVSPLSPSKRSSFFRTFSPLDTDERKKENKTFQEEEEEQGILRLLEISQEDEEEEEEEALGSATDREVRVEKEDTSVLFTSKLLPSSSSFSFSSKPKSSPSLFSSSPFFSSRGVLVPDNLPQEVEKEERRRTPEVHAPNLLHPYTKLSTREKTLEKKKKKKKNEEKDESKEEEEAGYPLPVLSCFENSPLSVSPSSSSRSYTSLQGPVRSSPQPTCQGVSSSLLLDSYHRCRTKSLPTSSSLPLTREPSGFRRISSSLLILSNLEAGQCQSLASILREEDTEKEKNKEFLVISSSSSSASWDRRPVSPVSLPRINRSSSSLSPLNERLRCSSSSSNSSVSRPPHLSRPAGHEGRGSSRGREGGGGGRRDSLDDFAVKVVETPDLSAHLLDEEINQEREEEEERSRVAEKAHPLLGVYTPSSSSSFSFSNTTSSEGEKKKIEKREDSSFNTGKIRAGSLTSRDSYLEFTARRSCQRIAEEAGRNLHLPCDLSSGVHTALPSTVTKKKGNFAFSSRGKEEREELKRRNKKKRNKTSLLFSDHPMTCDPHRNMAHASSLEHSGVCTPEEHQDENEEERTCEASIFSRERSHFLLLASSSSSSQQNETSLEKKATGSSPSLDPPGLHPSRGGPVATLSSQLPYTSFPSPQRASHGEEKEEEKKSKKKKEKEEKKSVSTSNHSERTQRETKKSLSSHTPQGGDTSQHLSSEKEHFFLLSPRQNPHSSTDTTKQIQEEEESNGARPDKSSDQQLRHDHENKNEDRKSEDCPSLERGKKSFLFPLNSSSSCSPPPPRPHLILPALVGDPIVSVHLNASVGVMAGSMLGRVSAFLFDQEKEEEGKEGIEDEEGQKKKKQEEEEDDDDEEEEKEERRKRTVEHGRERDQTISSSSPPFRQGGADLSPLPVFSLSSSSSSSCCYRLREKKDVERKEEEGDAKKERRAKKGKMGVHASSSLSALSSPQERLRRKIRRFMRSIPGVESFSHFSKRFDLVLSSTLHNTLHPIAVTRPPPLHPYCFSQTDVEDGKQERRNRASSLAKEEEKEKNEEPPGQKRRDGKKEKEEKTTKILMMKNLVMKKKNKEKKIHEEEEGGGGEEEETKICEWRCKDLTGIFVLFAAYGDDACTSVAITPACIYAVFGIHEIVRWECKTLKCLGGERVVPSQFAPLYRSSHAGGGNTSTTFFINRFPMKSHRFLLSSSSSSAFRKKGDKAGGGSMTLDEETGEKRSRSGGPTTPGRSFLGGGGVGLLIAPGSDAYDELQRYFCTPLWRSLEANAFVVLDCNGTFLLCVTSESVVDTRMFYLIDLRGACSSEYKENYSWSASRKNILYRFVVYKREAPRYFSLARIYRDSFLLVCEGSYGNCIVLYDATKEIYEYTQRRRTETLERRRQKKKKKQAPVSHKDEAPASSSSSSSFKRERVGKEEKERKEEEEEEEEKKNVSGEWDAEELCDLDGDCGVCDDDGFDLPQPPVVTPDKKKPSYTLIGHVYTIVAVDTNRGDDLLLSLSGEDSKLLLWKFGFTSPLQTFDCRPATFYLGWSWHVVSDEDLVAFSCDHGVYVMQLSHRRRCLLQRSRLLSLTRRRGRRRTSSYAPDRHLSQNREDKTRKKKQEAYKKQPFSTASVSKKKKKRHFFLLSGRKTKREKSK